MLKKSLNYIQILYRYLFDKLRIRDYYRLITDNNILHNRKAYIVSK